MPLMLTYLYLVKLCKLLVNSQMSLFILFDYCNDTNSELRIRPKLFENILHFDSF